MNRYLFLQKVIDSPKCHFCQDNEETIEHLLWSCPVTSIFGQNLQTTMKNECIDCSHLNFLEQLVLFGEQNNMLSQKAFNLILLMAKLFIFINVNEKRQNLWQTFLLTS